MKIFNVIYIEHDAIISIKSFVTLNRSDEEAAEQQAKNYFHSLITELGAGLDEMDECMSIGYFDGDNFGCTLIESEIMF